MHILLPDGHNFHNYISLMYFIMYINYECVVIKINNQLGHLHVLTLYLLKNYLA